MRRRQHILCLEQKYYTYLSIEDINFINPDLSDNLLFAEIDR